VGNLGCKVEDYADVPKQEEDAPFKRIYLVERGECPFETKTRVAQLMGGAALLVADQHCFQGEIWPDEQEQCQATWVSALPYLEAKDGGRDIFIPAFLLKKLDAQYLKNCWLEKMGKRTDGKYVKNLKYPNDIDQTGEECQANTEIVIKASLEVPVLEQASWELWMNSDDVPANLDMISKVSIGFKDFTDFKPNYLVFSAEHFGGCDWAGSQPPCPEMCAYSTNTKAGYCASPSFSSQVDGKAVVNENLRQLCIWDQVKDDQLIWWNYVLEFAKCRRDNGESQAAGSWATCQDLAMRLSPQINKDKLDACVKDEGFALLDETAKHMLSERIFTTSLSVNSVREDFGITGPFLAHSLCKSLNKKPAICNCASTINADDDLLRCMESKCYEKDKPFNCPHSSVCVKDLADCVNISSGMSGVGVFFVVLFVLAVAGGAGFVYHRRVRRQMQEEVRDILSEYVPLEAFSTRSDGFARGSGDANDTVGVI